MLDIAMTLMRSLNRTESDALTDAEVAALRLQTDSDERIDAYVRGWLVSEGAALWVLTSKRLLLLNLKERAHSQALALDQVTALEQQDGRYGTVLRLTTARQSRALIGAGRALSIAFATALAARAPKRVLADPAAPLSADEAATVAGLFTTARLRLQPAQADGAVTATAMLAQAAALHEQGVLTDAEFRGLKARLLEAA